MMKRSSSFPARAARACAALGAAALFACFLTYGSLTGSDFPRMLTGPPNLGQWSYSDLADLRANLIVNFRCDYADLQAYFDTLGRYDLQAVLYSGFGPRYQVEDFSYGQYMQYEAEMDSVTAINSWNNAGEIYYDFCHFGGVLDPAQPWPSGSSWKFRLHQDSPGSCLKGPNHVLGGSNECGLEKEWMNVPDQDHAEYRLYRHRLRVRADVAGLQPQDTVFRWILEYSYYDTLDQHDSVWTARVDSLCVTTNQFPSSNEFHTFTLDDTLYYHLEDAAHAGDFRFVFYRFIWTGACDVWVDWIRTMDLERGYLLEEPSTRDSLLAVIAEQCDSLEALCGDTLAYWGMGNTPARITFTAHHWINSTLRNQNHKPGCAFISHHPRDRHFDHFVKTGSPSILWGYAYPFKVGVSVGDQSELNALADSLEKARKACQDTLAWYWKCQAHYNLNEQRRNPTRAEILAQAWMALAHGAKGIGYYLYVSQRDAGGLWTDSGLVDSDFRHDYEPFLSKYQAVRDVFTQLDAVGNVLQTLQRDTAYCAFGRTDFPGFVDSIYCEDDPAGESYIEVGQFHNAQNDTFLIVVNRRTDGDRHISIKLDSVVSGAVLRDLYTDERFSDAEGTFHSIPFAAGAGRIFALERYKSAKKAGRLR